MNAASYSVIQADHIQLRGSLNLASVPQLWQELKDFTHTYPHSKLAVSLGAVTAVDTAGVALLVNWTVMANKRGISMSLFDTPENLGKLAKLSGVDSLLALQ